MDRRTFLTRTLAASATVSLTAPAAQALAADGDKSSSGKFKLKYAPSLGQFSRHAGKDPVDRLKFMADEGFGAMFDNGIMKKSKEVQKKIAAEMARLDMTLGPFVLYADFGKESFVTGKKQDREMLINRMKQGVETAKRVNTQWALVVPGRYNQRMAWEYQTANVVETLKACADVCEPSGLVLVIEPLNKHNHPGLFLTKIPQAYQICKAVDSPSCKIVNDIYHQQITEGNLIPNIEMAWDEIAAYHIGDNPGRKEPTTGEINYKNVFKYIHERGYKGVLCMEHGQSKSGKQGERAVIEAYRASDDF